MRSNGSTPFIFNQSVTGSGATLANQVVVAGSDNVVVDAIIPNAGNATTSITIRLETTDADELYTVQLDPTSAATLRDGINLGPRGLRSTKGLQFDLTNDGGTGVVAFTILYRNVKFA